MQLLLLLGLLLLLVMLLLVLLLLVLLLLVLLLHVLLLLVLLLVVLLLLVLPLLVVLLLVVLLVVVLLLVVLVVLVAAGRIHGAARELAGASTVCGPRMHVRLVAVTVALAVDLAVVGEGRRRGSRGRKLSGWRQVARLGVAVGRLLALRLVLTLRVACHGRRRSNRRAKGAD